MRKPVCLFLFSVFSVLICGCSILPEAAERSGWYQARLNEAKAYNEARKHIIGSKEIWVGTVVEEDSIRLILKDFRCLYSAVRSADLFGGYCDLPENNSFMLERQFLKTPLRRGDRIIFTATHTMSSGLMDGTGYPHPVDGSRMAKIDPVTGELSVIEYDSAALNKAVRQKLTAPVPVTE